MLVEDSLGEVLGTHALQCLQDAIGAGEGVCATDCDAGCGIGDGEVEDVGPRAAVDVVPIRMLQVADCVFVLQSRDSLCELVEC